MLQEMRLILNVHRVPGMDDVPPTCPQVLQMATEHGAGTTPLAGQIGRLEPGRLADFVVINHQRALYPYQDDQIPILDAIMQRAKTGAVDATVIGGVTVDENGRFTRIDRDAILAEIAGILGQPRTAADPDLITLSHGMQGFVRQFYDGYFDPAPFKPFYKQSSTVLGTFWPGGVSATGAARRPG